MADWWRLDWQQPVGGCLIWLGRKGGWKRVCWRGFCQAVPLRVRLELPSGQSGQYSRARAARRYQKAIVTIIRKVVAMLIVI